MRKVRLDVERWEVLALEPLTHWCSKCKRMHDTWKLDEDRMIWYNGCGGAVLLQQLIIEGLVSESKWLGIEHA